MALLEVRNTGLYCPAGDFHIDPALPVDRALITHAHGDHARPGSRAYLTARPGEALLRARLGEDAAIQSEDYGVPVGIGGFVLFGTGGNMPISPPLDRCHASLQNSPAGGR